MLNTKKELKYSIGFEDQEDCNRLNKEGFNFKPYDEQVLDMCVEISEAIHEVAEAGGFFLYDGVKVKISIEYEEENK